MKKETGYLILWTIALSSFIGCSTTRVITPQTEWTLAKDAALVTSNGASLGTRFVSTTGDSIVARDYTFDRNLQFDFSEVAKVEIKNHNKGALQGFLFLGAAGALGGLAASLLYTGDNNDGLRYAAPFIWGMFGGAAGALIGAAKGNTETYLFEQTQEQTNTSERNSSVDAELARTKRQ